MGSGYALYDIEKDMQKERYYIPVLPATEQNLKGYAKIVQDYDSEDVIITRWPVAPSCYRQITDGVSGGISEGLFRFKWNGQYCTAINEAVGGDYTICKKCPENGDLLVREANYHPDGGQIVCPTDQQPYYAVLGKTSDTTCNDNVKPKDFVAFKCDGTFGMQILPNIWHQPMIPEHDMVFKNKQGAVHACVRVDTLDEFNTWLAIRN